MNAKRNLTPSSPFSPFVLYPLFLSHYFTFPSLFWFFFPLLAVLCHCCNFFLQREAIKIFVLQTIPKKKGSVFPVGQGKPWRFTHISSCSTKFFPYIQISDVFICPVHEAPFVFFPWFRLSITIHLTPAMAGSIHRTMLQPRHSREQCYCCTPPPPPLRFCTPVPSARCSWLKSSRNQRESAVQDRKSVV